MLYICTGYIQKKCFVSCFLKECGRICIVSRLGHTHIRFKPKYWCGYLLLCVLFALDRLSPQVQRAVQRLFCSYLGMLVNTKNDLALAHTLNTPNRCLGRTAFTDLKHAARKSNTSLFLVNVSLSDSQQMPNCQVLCLKSLYPLACSLLTRPPVCNCNL